VIAAKRLGAEQIIILGPHEDRIVLAKEFGATNVVSERGEEAVERVRELGVPREKLPASRPAFFSNVTVGGGPAQVRAYIEELLPDILDGRIDPGRVFDRTVDLESGADVYRAMADRESVKVMVTP
jgi:threonine dehydrogenase-like Zn-dependent dehydrogenase